MSENKCLDESSCYLAKNSINLESHFNSLTLLHAFILLPYNTATRQIIEKYWKI